MTSRLKIIANTKLYLYPDKSYYMILSNRIRSYCFNVTRSLCSKMAGTNILRTIAHMILFEHIRSCSKTLSRCTNNLS